MIRTIEDRQSKRVHFSLIPAMFDKVTVIYPDEITEVYTYSLLDDNGNSLIVGMVEVIYTDAKKANLLSVERLQI